MLNRDREKLINAVLYFAHNTKHCGKIKVLKLLYLLDFEHFRQTGRSVTGMDYLAWKMGPVPFELYQEWDVLAPDLAAAIEIVPTKVIDLMREEVHPRVAFDDSHFSKRELRLMDELATRFADEYSKSLIGVTHRELGPWQKIWDSGRGNNERIPYALAVTDDDPHREAILESALQHTGLRVADGRLH